MQGISNSDGTIKEKIKGIKEHKPNLITTKSNPSSDFKNLFSLV